MRRSFPYSKRVFVLNLAFLGILLVGTLVILLMMTIDLGYLALIMVLELALILVLGISPFLTDHEVADGRLVLRQGWYFRSEIPLGEIRSVERIPKGPSRTGVFFRVLTSTVFVTTRRTDLIEIELRKKRTFGWALGKKADCVVFDAEEVPALMKALEPTSLSPVQPQRP
jgi:hypothetical protein